MALLPSDAVVPDGYAWAPTPDAIAALLSAYAREHVGGYASADRQQAGRERTTFTTGTSPTIAQVQEFIVTACDEVAGRVDVEIPDRCHGLAGAAAKWYAGALVLARRQAAGADDTEQLRLSFMSNFTASLKDLKDAARRGKGLRIS